MTKILVVGGGFAGTWAALSTVSEASRQKAQVEVILLSRDEYLTNRPRLYEAFVDDLRFPLLPILQKVGVALLTCEVISINPAQDKLMYRRGDEPIATLQYDRLVLAAGSAVKKVPIPGLVEHGFDVDTFAGAEALEAHLQSIFLNPSRSPGSDCVVVMGGGFAGIELVTELRNRIAGIAGPKVGAAARIVLVDRAEVVGEELGSGPRPAIEKALAESRVEVILGQSLKRIDASGAELEDGTPIASRTIIATTGLVASPLAETLPIDRDEWGRVSVDDYLQAEGLPRIFAAGDVARAWVDDAHLALMSCQHAMPMGRYAGCNAVRDVFGLALCRYRQPEYVTCVDLGASGAIFTKGWNRDVVMEGEEAKTLKREIVTELIALPSGTREEILEAARVEAEVESI